jgi:hypothetical protein
MDGEIAGFIPNPTAHYRLVIEILASLPPARRFSVKNGFFFRNYSALVRNRRENGCAWGVRPGLMPSAHPFPQNSLRAPE